ncbi:hypothetical protein ACFVT5_19380 [Streptomyces sp. NPDC058001]|uniref:hypothetical protein n=1 Tax=Streptomyces sp. NPDC058001 TaxID=3346300 RepID=UPI0036E57ACE
MNNAREELYATYRNIAAYASNDPHQQITMAPSAWLQRDQSQPTQAAQTGQAYGGQTYGDQGQTYGSQAYYAAQPAQTTQPQAGQASQSQTNLTFMSPVTPQDYSQGQRRTTGESSRRHQEHTSGTRQKKSSGHGPK